MGAHNYKEVYTIFSSYGGYTLNISLVKINQV